MKVLSKTADLLPTLQTFEEFRPIAPKSLEWLITQSEYRYYEDGEFLFEPGMPQDHMVIIMEGKFYVRIIKDGDMKELGTWEKGNVTGVLPFSRMKEAKAHGIVQGELYALALHRNCFTEMVNVDYNLTQNLVGLMSDRIREFTSLRSQDEKLMSLGRLSAGLAHELNNPASAMKRSAEELHKKIHRTPDKFKKVMAMELKPEDIDRINEIMNNMISKENLPDLSLMEREEKLDELIDWMDDNDIPNGEDLAETFVDFDLSIEELDEIRTILNAHEVAGVLGWIESNLSLDRIVAEIQEAADRISTLVKSVKAYSHMDRADTRETLDIHDGLRNTLIMLKHKFKHGNIDVEKDWNHALPHIIAHASSLNQVWTNLIVNAVDAMPDGGKLTIRTRQDRDFLCVDVMDTGTGISEEDISKIYDPFFTTKPMGEGTGMGLDIVKKVLSRHKATIRVKSKPGETIFTVCFPFAQVQVPVKA